MIIQYYQFYFWNIIKNLNFHIFYIKNNIKYYIMNYLLAPLAIK